MANRERKMHLKAAVLEGGEGKGPQPAGRGRYPSLCWERGLGQNVD